MSLPPELKSKYTIIIDGILASSDLNTISAKRIRKGVASTAGEDITPYKDEVTELILERFDVAEARNNAIAGSTNGNHTANGTKAKSPRPTNANGKRTSASDEEVSSAPSPAPKKHKSSKSVEDADAAFAAKLQAQENGRARSTRGGGVTKRKSTAKRTPAKKAKSKSKAKIGSDDDSDAESGAEKEVNRTGGFHKPMMLSEPLAALLGETQLSRPQTVKKIWQYIKANDLQDPDDKRQVLCDNALRSVFKTDKVHMFTMNKILSQNLYNIEE